MNSGKEKRLNQLCDGKVQLTFEKNQLALVEIFQDYHLLILLNYFLHSAPMETPIENANCSSRAFLLTLTCQ